MSKPSPYCECHKWDQPGGICAYCTGYTDGWTTETTALRRERDALRLHLGRVLRMFKDETSQGDGMSEDHVADYEAAKAALREDEAAAGKGVG